MSPDVCSRVFLQLLVLLLASNIQKTHSLISPEDCLDFDTAALESFLSQLNLRDVPSVKSMTGGFKCPLNALPFGALKSDWSRLLLLQDAQPKDSLLRSKLHRLFRVLLVAYYQMEEKFELTTFEHSKMNVSGAYETPGITERIIRVGKAGGDLRGKVYPSNTDPEQSRGSSVSLGKKQAALKLLVSPEVTSTIATSYFDPVNKMRQPQILRKSPKGNEFWKYVPVPEKVLSSSTAIGPLSDRGDDTTSTIPENNVEKIFRWFYGRDRGVGFNSTPKKSRKECGAVEKSCCN